jgi:hypothetical protein
VAAARWPASPRSRRPEMYIMPDVSDAARHVAKSSAGLSPSLYQLSHGADVMRVITAGSILCVCGWDRDGFATRP